MVVLFFAAFFAGVLTVAAPCILPLLPVILGGSIVRQEKKRPDYTHAIVIALSLATSVVIFTLLLKATSALLGVPQQVWQIVSGLIVIALGLGFVIPALWEQLSLKLKLQERTETVNQRAGRIRGYGGDILVGASLGPVFSSCSPTYAFIVAAVLPRSFIEGLIYLLAYAAGLTLTLLLIGVFGRKLTAKMGWLSNPNGPARKIVGLLFILVGLAVIFGFDKDFQSWVLDRGWYMPIENIEHRLRN